MDEEKENDEASYIDAMWNALKKYSGGGGVSGFSGHSGYGTSGYYGISGYSGSRRVFEDDDIVKAFLAGYMLHSFDDSPSEQIKEHAREYVEKIKKL